MRRDVDPVLDGHRPLSYFDTRVNLRFPGDLRRIMDCGPGEGFTGPLRVKSLINLPGRRLYVSDLFSPRPPSLGDPPHCVNTLETQSPRRQRPDVKVVSF